MQKTEHVATIVEARTSGNFSERFMLLKSLLSNYLDHFIHYCFAS